MLSNQVLQFLHSPQSGRGFNQIVALDHPKSRPHIFDKGRRNGATTDSRFEKDVSYDKIGFGNPSVPLGV